MNNNRVLAKLKNKGRRTGAIRQLFSDKIIFPLPDLSNAIEYDDERKLEENQWFKLTVFSEKPFYPSFLSLPLTSIYSAISKTEYGLIDFIFGTLSSERYIWFLNITPGRYLKNPMIQMLTEEPFLVENDHHSFIELENTVHAVFDTQSDTLFFKNLSNLTSIFRGIEELYHEATEEDVVAFLDSDIINPTSGYCSDMVKTANRKRLTAAKKKYDSFDAEQKKLLRDYLKEYCPTLTLNDNSFDVSNEEEMADLLNGINQRYYTTPIDKEKRIANTITVLE